jgi:predicted DNA-binding transcriptional regulator AlpA
MPSAIKGLVPLSTVLRRLGISRPTAYRWIAAGHLPQPVKKMPGKTSPIFFRVEEIDAFAKKLGPRPPRRARRR